VMLFSLLPCTAIAGETSSFFKGLRNDLSDNYQQFYASDNLSWLGSTLALGGVMANTRIDQKFQAFYNESIRSSTTDEIARIAKMLGDREIVLLYAGLTAYNRLYCDDRDCGRIPEWGDRTLRAILTGLPAVWLSQALLGGARPHNGDSEWTLFRFDKMHAVSGHSFIGAVPFLTAAQMTDNDASKAILYSLSTLTALSRINDQKHYLSQALMGWMYAAKVTDELYIPLNPGESVVLPYADDDSVSLTWVKSF